MSGYFGPEIWSAPLAQYFPSYKAQIGDVTLKELWIPIILFTFFVAHAPACVVNVAPGTKSEESAFATYPLRVDSTARFCCMQYGLAWIAILEVVGRQPSRSILPDYVPRIRTYDDQDYPSTPHTSTLSVLDHNACTYDRWSSTRQPPVLYHPGDHLWTHLRELRAVVSSCLLRLCRRRVRPMGTPRHYEHLRLPRYQLFDDSEEGGGEEHETKWCCKRCAPWKRSQRLTCLISQATRTTTPISTNTHRHHGANVISAYLRKRGRIITK